MTFPCRICGENAVEPAPGFGVMARIGSDSTPFRPGGELGQCRACGAVQKPPTPQFRADCEAIYAGYTMYGQSSTHSEPAVFDAAPTGRSVRIAEVLCRELRAPKHGRLLDIGCGNGSLLRAFARQRPAWRLAGLEKDDRNRAALETIPGFDTLHTGTPEALDATYDIVSLVHVLEHLPDPVAYLAGLHPLLAGGGALLVHLPLWHCNPFDLVVADHGLHFDARSLGLALARAGLRPVRTDAAVVPGELTVIARRADPGEPEAASGSRPDLGCALNWLRAAGERARRLRRDDPARFGVFGTGNGATWITETAGPAAFYVDEDPTRVGRHRRTGVPVLAPENVPADAVVFIALSSGPAAAVRSRNRERPGRWIAPPGPGCRADR